MQFDLEYRRGETGRPEGSVARHTDASRRDFVGHLELLRLLEDAADEEQAASGSASVAGDERP